MTLRVPAGRLRERSWTMREFLVEINGFPRHMRPVRNVAPARHPALAETAPDPNRVAA